MQWNRASEGGRAGQITFDEVSVSTEGGHLLLGWEMAHQRGFGKVSAQIIDDETDGLVQGSGGEASGILEQELDRLDDLAEALLVNETPQGMVLPRISGKHSNRMQHRINGETTTKTG
jgi:ATP-dependent Zn protease